MLTNKGLAEHAKKALTEKWGYVWGTFGTTLTKALFQQKLNQYPNEVGQYKDFILSNWLNHRTVDCIGLIKGYYWSSEDGKTLYNLKTDLNANDMYAKATEKGSIDTMPELSGICVYKYGHIGVYIGNGQVIEARGTKDGVIQTPLKGLGATIWTNWLKCPYIEYEQEIPKSILRYGSKGEDVKLLQNKLNELGYKLIVDGHYGIITQGAVRDYQRTNSLKIDGIVGPETWAKLFNQEAKNKKMKYYIEGITHVVEVDPMDLRISVHDLAANVIQLDNFVTSGFQMVQVEKTGLPIFPTSLEKIQKGKYLTYPVGILVSEGHIIQNRQPHGKAAGTMIVYRDGKVECRPVLNLLTETNYNNIWFAVSGCSILPKIRMVEEGFVGKFADIGRICPRPVIGYRKKDNKIVIAVRNSSNIGRGQLTLKNLGCDFGITLDAGGSTVLRVNGAFKFNTIRWLHNVITW